MTGKLAAVIKGSGFTRMLIGLVHALDLVSNCLFWFVLRPHRQKQLRHAFGQGDRIAILSANRVVLLITNFHLYVNSAGHLFYAPSIKD